MPTSGFQLWTRRVLYRALLALALVLALVLSISPFLPLDSQDNTLARLWHLFAQDATLRQTAVIAALGLWVTAVVFFRSRKETLDLGPQPLPDLHHGQRCTLSASTRQRLQRDHASG